MKLQRALLTILLMTLMGFVGACAKKNDSTSINHRRCSRGGCSNGTANYVDPNTGVVLNPNSTRANTAWGQIHRGQKNQSGFYQEVQKLVSSTINPYANPPELGYVSGEMNQDTGIWFWGDVRSTMGVINPGANQNVQLDPQSAELRIVIWDSYAGTQLDGENVPEYPIHIRGASFAQISGGTATIQFQDSYGFIRLDGQINGQYFQGRVTYQNRTSFDGSPGAAGELGTFYVPTCGFFRCSP